MDEGTLPNTRIPYKHHFKDAVWGTAGWFPCLELQWKKGMQFWKAWLQTVLWFRCWTPPLQTYGAEVRWEESQKFPKSLIASVWGTTQVIRLTLVSVPTGCSLGGKGASSNPSAFFRQSASPFQVIFNHSTSAASGHLSLSLLFSPKLVLPPSPVFNHVLLPGKYLQFFLLGSSTATSTGKVKGRSSEASCLY